jgi:hypothetical protein
MSFASRAGRVVLSRRFPFHVPQSYNNNLPLAASTERISHRWASSAAALEEPSKPRRRTTLETKSPLTVVRFCDCACVNESSAGVLEIHSLTNLHSSTLTLSQTERAADRIKEILAGDSAAGALGIRLGVKRREFYFVVDIFSIVVCY